MGCDMAGITSLKIGVKTASDRHNAAVRLRPGQSAEQLLAEKNAKAQATEERAQAPKLTHPDIKPSESEKFGPAYSKNRCHKTVTIGKLRRQVQRLQETKNALAQRHKELVAKETSQRQEIASLKREASFLRTVVIQTQRALESAKMNEEQSRIVTAVAKLLHRQTSDVKRQIEGCEV